MLKKLLNNWQTNKRFRRVAIVLAGILAILLIALAGSAFSWIRGLEDGRSQAFVKWGTGDRKERAELITVQREVCPGAPFILPTDGFIGLLYGDPRGPYSERRPHQGIDIFSNAGPGVVPVYAAYDGYITREDGWRSALIQRIPSDPLQPDRQIWLYYTHMAAEDGTSFIVDALPPNTRDVFVEQGTLLGYTGDYNGNAARDVWVHLHFSIVRDDGRGSYTNELDFDNTIDPSAYLGMPVNVGCAEVPPSCTENPLCPDAVLSAADN